MKITVEPKVVNRLVRNYVIKEIGLPKGLVGDISSQIVNYGYDCESEFTGIIVEIKENVDEE